MGMNRPGGTEALRGPSELHGLLDRFAELTDSAHAALEPVSPPHSWRRWTGAGRSSPAPLHSSRTSDEPPARDSGRVVHRLASEFAEVDARRPAAPGRRAELARPWWQRAAIAADLASLKRAGAARAAYGPGVGSPRGPEHDLALKIRSAVAGLQVTIDPRRTAHRIHSHDSTPPMSYGSTTSRYLENEVLSRPQEWLVPLLFDHLIASLTRASVQIGAGDMVGKTASLDKASRIVLELLGSLDHEKGGEIATALGSLYSFLAGEIMSVGRTLDLEYLGQLTSIASELHEAWVQAAEQVAPRGRSGALAARAAVA